MFNHRQFPNMEGTPSDSECSSENSSSDKPHLGDEHQHQHQHQHHQHHQIQSNDNHQSSSSLSSPLSSSDDNSDESIGESSEEPLESARILKQRFELPKALCEDPVVFNEFFSVQTWNELAQPIQMHLVENFLPKFPENDGREKEISIQRMFDRLPFRFGSSPLLDFQRHLEDGNYRPDIARLRANIWKSQRREQRFQECERISRIAKAVIISREKLLRQAYESPPGAVLKVDRTLPVVPRFSSSAAAMRAKKRYFQEINAIADEVGIVRQLSEDENYPEGPPTQLSRKQKKHLSGIQGGAVSPGAETRVISTLSRRGGSFDHLVGPGGAAPLSEDFYRQMLLKHKKRRIEEPDHLELDTDDVRLKDICSRTQLTGTSQRRTIGHYNKHSNATGKRNLLNSKVKAETASGKATKQQHSSVLANHLPYGYSMTGIPELDEPSANNLPPYLSDMPETPLPTIKTETTIEESTNVITGIDKVLSQHSPKSDSDQDTKNFDLKLPLLSVSSSNLTATHSTSPSHDNIRTGLLQTIKTEPIIPETSAMVVHSNMKVAQQDFQAVVPSKKRVSVALPAPIYASSPAKITKNVVVTSSIPTMNTNGTIFNAVSSTAVSNNSGIQSKNVTHDHHLTILHDTTDSSGTGSGSVAGGSVSPAINLTHYYTGKVKAATLSDLEGIDMMHLPVDLDDSGNIDILGDLDDDDGATITDVIGETPPTLMQETYACFLSLVRDIFCATPDHRTTIDNLHRKIIGWLGNPIAPLNEWYSMADNWLALLPSAIHFLAGDFVDQPEEFVPYVEYKTALQIYQWIGAGRDTDSHLMPLCSYWLSRRGEMGTRAIQTSCSSLKGSNSSEANSKYKVSAAATASATAMALYTSSDYEEYGVSGQPERPISPPPPRFPTNWVVQRAGDEEIEEFRVQERRRFDNPHMSFTYVMHGYESVVGPVKGIYTQVPGITKARGHNMLTADRPNFVTILTLVRDATARLPNGEGTRADICELLKSSQYISTEAAENVLQTIVSGALDRMHTEHDPCVRYDAKRKIWIYLHRNRSEDEFERLHQQYQGMGKHKKPALRKFKPNKPTKLPGEVLKPTITATVTTVVTHASSTTATVKVNCAPADHLYQSTVVVVPPAPPPLSTLQPPMTVLQQSSALPPLLNKLPSPKGLLKAELVPIKQQQSHTHQSLPDRIEHIDVEASLDVQATLLAKPGAAHPLSSFIVDSKKVANTGTVKTATLVTSGKTLSLVAANTTPVKVSTSAGIQTVHVSPASSSVSSHLQTGKSLPTILSSSTQNQSILVNATRSQSPIVVGTKKMVGKQVIITQNQAPPLIGQSVGATGGTQSYIIPFNFGNAGVSGNEQFSKVITSISAGGGNLTAVTGAGAKLVKGLHVQQHQQPPALAVSKGVNFIQQQQQQQQQPPNTIKTLPTSVRINAISAQAGKSLINPAIVASNINMQQKNAAAAAAASGTTALPSVHSKIIHTTSSNLMNNVAVAKGTTITKPIQQLHSTSLTAAQQKKILQNILVQQKQQHQQQHSVGGVVPKSIIVSQQQSATGGPQKTIISAAGHVAGSTPVTVSANIMNPQIIQIQQTSSGQKLQTVSGASLTVAQHQNIMQNIKQQQQQLQQQLAASKVQQVQGGVVSQVQQQQQQQQQQSLIIKQQQPPFQKLFHTATANTKPTTVSIIGQSHTGTVIVTAASTMPSTTTANPTAVSISQMTRVTKVGNIQTPTTIRTGTAGHQPVVAKVLTNSSGQLISLESLLQKQGIAPGTTLRVAGAKPGQTNLIQLASAPGSQITQYAVVSQGRNLISVTTPHRVIAGNQTTSVTTASSFASMVKAGGKNIKTIQVSGTTVGGSVGQTPISTTTAPRPQQQTILQQQQSARIVSQLPTQQQLMNAKLLSMQNVSGAKIKPATGIRMVNASNLNIAHIGGKPVIIASKAATTTTSSTSSQNVILQGSGSQTTNGTNLVIGGQTLKVQGSVISPSNLNLLNQSNTPQTVMFGNQVVKVQTQHTLQQQHNQMQQSSGGTLASGAASPVINTSNITSTTKTVVLGTTGQTIKMQSATHGHITTTGTSTVTGHGGQQIVLGPSIKAGIKSGVTATTTGQQRVVLAVQGGGQILLPPGFQGGAINLKTLQGLKVIPIQQQSKGSSDERQLFAQILPPQTNRPPQQNSQNTRSE